MTYEPIRICEACGKIIGEDDPADESGLREHIWIHESCAQGGEHGHRNTERRSSPGDSDHRAI